MKIPRYLIEFLAAMVMSFCLLFFIDSSSAETSRMKMQRLSSCLQIAQYAAYIQEGRRTHRDTWMSFNAKVPVWLSRHLPSEEVRAIVAIAKEVFNSAPIEAGPFIIYDLIYSRCIERTQKLSVF